MRTLILKGTVITGIVLFAFCGCNKNRETQQVVSPYMADITVVADKVLSGMDTQEVFADNPATGIYMVDDGIVPDFLIDETDLSGTDEQRAYIRDHSIIVCLKKLSLKESQKDSVLKELRIYNKCKEQAVSRAKEIYRDLQVKYKEKYNRLYNAFLNGSITGEKFKAMVAELRLEFKKELRSLHLKEKLDEAFKTCFRKFLAGLHPILTERQWNAFIACCKG